MVDRLAQVAEDLLAKKAESKHSWVVHAIFADHDPNPTSSCPYAKPGNTHFNTGLQSAGRTPEEAVNNALKREGNPAVHSCGTNMWIVDAIPLSDLSKQNSTE